MKSSTKNWIILGMAVVILTGIFFLGYSRYPVWNPSNEGKVDTIFIHDTVPKHIVDSFPYYIVRKDSIKYKDQQWIDSILKANEVDTAALFNIFREFYSVNYYTRVWEDTLVRILINDIITENRPDDNNFTYQLLKPLTIINNSITVNNYSKYIYLGGSVSIPDSKFSNFGTYIALPRSFYGLSYMPWQKGVMATAGFKIIKLK